MSQCQKGRNKRIAKSRARVEHPFAQMRHMGGKFIRTIGQARATVAMTMMAACYNLKRPAKFLGDGVDAFYKIAPSKTEVRLQGATMDLASASWVLVVVVFRKRPSPAGFKYL